MKTINECIEQDEFKKLYVRREMVKTFSLQSAKNFLCKVIAIDKCVFKNSDLKRCDYLFLVKKNDNKGIYHNTLKAFYMELKGVNIQYACEQLYNAIKLTKLEILNYSIEAKVISVKGFQPNILNNEYFRKVKKLIKKEISFHKVHKGNNYTHTEIIN